MPYIAEKIELVENCNIVFNLTIFFTFYGFLFYEKMI